MVAAAALAAAPAVAQVPASGPLRGFKDWVIGCDNLRGCTALGLMADQGTGGFLRIERGGAAAAEPVVRFSVMVEAAEPKDAALTVVVDGQGAPAVDHRPARLQDGQVSLVLRGPSARGFIEALRLAHAVTLTLFDGTKAVQEVKVSLAGAAAALLFMDDQQKRTGTETALVDHGGASAAAEPPVPALPAVAAMRMTVIDKPGRRPAGVPKPKDKGCPGDDLVIRLSAGEVLWGVCAFAAAYNWGYSFWRVGAGAPTALKFALPGADPHDDGHVLVNPALRADGLAITALNKGRGLGDCGVIADWAWDGSAFRPVRIAEMRACGGVPPDDWPVLLRAQTNPRR
ncbi:hypothetical protein GCM10010994_25880 [Chelatococcus reniformis]|uniref:DUF1176 domain-containing protein n=2 Tax=Chelatococcus reniformis TaxID=1494448 RepID=A0A916UAP0_9HYPH|nr:hypothetical protein GCM10010994_25880 [Chelatococcus reniformis]